MKKSLQTLLLLGALAAVATQGSAQTTAATQSPDDEIVRLSPFTVDTTQDKGYRATNSISGTRLNTPIKDVPIPIEIITSEFIRDTGAVDLREALQYSAGVILQSQGDFGRDVSDLDDGAEGVTGTKEQTSIKLRGFATTESLRRGFRRASYSDSVAIDRVEVVRGPSALLYGIGNFGGIVNYLPKTPQTKPRYVVQAAVGSWDYYRTEVDLTGPLTGSANAAYRLVAAADRTDDWTEFKGRESYFVMPSFAFDPFEKTHVLVDVELGRAERTGTSFQSLRATDGAFTSAGRKESSFLPTPGKDPRTFRWSGPDTYLNEDNFNASAEVTQHLAGNLTFLLGAQLTRVEFDRRDVRARLDRSSASPVALRRVVTFQPQGLFPRLNVNAALGYTWTNSDEVVDTSQLRAEFTYNLKVGGTEHNLLAGYSMLGRTRTNVAFTTRNSPAQLYNWQAPDDLSYFRHDPANQVPLIKALDQDLKRWDQGLYFVYQGKFFRDRLQVLGGLRYDRADAATITRNLATGNVDTVMRGQTGKPTTEWSPQIGASFALTQEISIFALRSTGLVPNDDKVDGANNPFVPTKAVSKEAGFKVDLFNGKLSGTASLYQIDRKDTPQYFWYAPAPGRTTLFDPTRPVAYVPYFNNVPLFDSVPADRAVLQQLFDGQYAPTSTAPMNYYLYNGGTNANFPANGAYCPIDDQSKGFDVQIIVAPADGWQVVLGYAHVERKLTLGPKLVKAPVYSPFAAYYANARTPVGQYGFGPASNWSDPTDSSTYNRSFGIGQSFDDTPSDTYTLWNNYRFQKNVLKGFNIGTGLRYEGPRDYSAGGITVDGGLNFPYTNAAGTSSNADRYKESDPRYTVDLLLGYSREIGGCTWDFRLNVFNLLDEQGRYGDIYTTPRSLRFTAGVTF